jgi:hypothetical protein
MNRLHTYESFRSGGHRKVNETVLKVGEDYKVKVIHDIPVSMVEEYVQKVKEETGTNPLDNYSEIEIAEEMVRYTLKQSLLLDQIPVELFVGDSESEEVSEEDAEDEFEEEAEHEEEITPSGEDEEADSGDEFSGEIEFDTEIKEVGEKDQIVLDTPEDKKNN